MYKKYRIMILLLLGNSTHFYAIHNRQLLQLYTIAVAGVGTTTAAMYLGGKSSQVNFDKNKTIHLVQADIENTTTKFKAKRQEFIQKEIAFYKEMQTKTKNLMNKKDK